MADRIGAFFFPDPLHRTRVIMTASSDPFAPPLPAARKGNPKKPVHSAKNIAAVAIMYLGSAACVAILVPGMQDPLPGLVKLAALFLAFGWLPMTLILFGLENRRAIAFRLFFRIHFWLAVALGIIFASWFASIMFLGALLNSTRP